MKNGFSVCTGGKTHSFKSLKELMAKTSPLRSGDVLAGVAAAEAPQSSAILGCSGGYKFPPLCRNGALHLYADENRP